jgi:hypothetical protein
MSQMSLAAAALAIALILGAMSGAHAQQQAPARPAQTPPQTQAAPAPAARRFDPITAPSGQEMIRALIAIQATPLARLTRCAGKGASETDVDVGDFLAGYASTFGEQGHNWIATLARRRPGGQRRAGVARPGLVPSQPRRRGLGLGHGIPDARRRPQPGPRQHRLHRHGLTPRRAKAA